MLFIPLIYFILLATYFYMKHRCLNLDIAATLLLVVVSIFSIIIDFYDVYGDYGINEYSVTLPTILLYCLQWTIVLLPLHFISSIKIKKHEPHKSLMLYLLFAILIISSITMILTSLSAIREALIMDMVDVYRQNDFSSGTPILSSVYATNCEQTKFFLRFHSMFIYTASSPSMLYE